MNCQIIFKMDKRILTMKNTASHFKRDRWLGSFFNSIDLLLKKKKKKKSYVYKYKGKNLILKLKYMAFFLI